MDQTDSSQARRIQRRTFELAAAVVVACRELPRSAEAFVIRSQLVRCATSTAANYRAACRAQSEHAFVAKLSIAIEEADEVLLWLNLIARVELAPLKVVRPLAEEADQIVRILVASRKTMQMRMGRKSKGNRQSSIVNRQCTAS